jgi:citrate lyase subunit beta/citryl-CoA lyase
MTVPKRVQLRRSYLFAPGNNRKLLGKVFDAGADAVVLDLEDAVPPAEKPAAREMVRETLQERAPATSPGIFVRVNHPATDWWREDVRAVVGPWLTGIRLPKANAVQEVEKVADLLDEAEPAAGLERGATPLICTIESAVGVMNLERIARARRVVGFAYGASDLSRDLGAELVGDELETLYVRSRLVLVSAALGLQPPIASVQTDLADTDRLRSTTLAARRLGFFGRSCIHPKQLPIVHEVFTPDPERVERARAIVRAYREQVASGSGSFSMPDGQFVDEAIARQAEALVDLAESLQL